MYLKLIMQNAKRSIKEYSIFMFTITMVMTLLYAFNSLMFSKQIITLMGDHADMLSAFLMVSFLLVILMSWLIGYISNFMIKNRSREFGLYLLSGMKRHHIARMLVVEMMIMGLFSFLIGCILGSFLSEMLRMIISQFFYKNFDFSIQFSFHTLGVTAIYFVLMWILTLWKEHRTIMKVSIRELLYEENKNKVSISRYYLKWIALVIAVFCFWTGYEATRNALLNMLKGEDAPEMMKGVVLLIISNYAFYYGIMALIDVWINKQKNFKFHKTVLPLYGHIKGRINRNCMVLATLSMLLIFSIMLSSFGIKLYDSSMEQLKILCPYELLVISNETLPSDKIRNMLENKGYKVDDHVYQLYKNKTVHTNLDDIRYEYGDLKEPKFIKESDYRKLLKMKHITIEEIPQNGYILLVNEYMKKILKKTDVELILEGKKMKQFQIVDHHIGVRYDDLIIILKDELLKDDQVDSWYYVANTDVPLALEMEKEIANSHLADFSIISTRADTEQSSTSSSVTIIFSIFYLSFVFICIAATIMATQQMMDATRQKYEYELMHQLGMDKTEIYASLRKQIGIYFFVPMALPTIYIFPLLHILNILFIKIPGTYSIYTIAFGCIVLYLIIYLCYYMMAYIGCKRHLDLK